MNYQKFLTSCLTPQKAVVIPQPFPISTIRAYVRPQSSPTLIFLKHLRGVFDFQCLCVVCRQSPFSKKEHSFTITHAHIVHNHLYLTNRRAHLEAVYYFSSEKSIITREMEPSGISDVLPTLLLNFRSVRVSHFLNSQNIIRLHPKSSFPAVIVGRADRRYLLRMKFWCLRSTHTAFTLVFVRWHRRTAQHCTTYRIFILSVFS